MQRDPDIINCGNCMFACTDGKQAFRCYRFPPITLFEKETNKYTWLNPAVDKQDFCGEFLPKDNLTAVEWVAWKKGLLEDGTNVSR